MHIAIVKRSSSLSNKRASSVFQIMFWCSSLYTKFYLIYQNKMRNTGYNEPHITEKEAKVGLGSTLACMAFGMAIPHLVFIICDLIFAGQGTDCVRTPVPGISFTLDFWLRVDAYTRIFILVLLLLIAIITCVSLKAGTTLLMVFFVILILYSLFSIAWYIVGAIMFWGHLNPGGKCTGGVQIYMWILLLLSFIQICCNFCLGGTDAGMAGILFKGAKNSGAMDPYTDRQPFHSNVNPQVRNTTQFAH